jgi:hypothetical protein
MSEAQREIHTLEHENKTLLSENTKQASEITQLKKANTELKSVNESLRARFFSFITSFLGFLHSDKNIKITGDGPFDADKANVMVEDYRKQVIAERQKQDAASTKKTGQPASTSSSWFDMQSWGTFFGSSEPPKASHHKTHAPAKDHTTRAQHSGVKHETKATKAEATHGAPHLHTPKP